MPHDEAPAGSASPTPLFPEGQCLIGVGESPLYLELTRANRHGLIAGATGTGKTVTLQILAEGFASAGVPVFMADVKGDLAGISAAGEENAKLAERARRMGLEPLPDTTLPTVFWDVFATHGHPVRITISDVGPALLSRLFELSEAQEGVLTIAFTLADEEGLLLLDIADLQALLSYVAENAKALSAKYGNVSPTTVAAIQRKLLQLKQEGAEHLFGEPALDIHDLMRTSRDGLGVINILSAEVLIQKPRVYATLLLWLLSELFEQLPEAGDLDKPKLVFFFDEAHLLFEDAEKSLLQKIEQVVRLIRSKGVGVYFVTQQPRDIPGDVLAQLGNRVQHALRAFTPAEQKAVKAAATSFRANPAFDTETCITELGVGEALVSVLTADGTPSVVQRARIRPPFTRLGPISAEERKHTMARDVIGDSYDAAINRESAYEMLAKRRADAIASASATEAPNTRTPVAKGRAEQSVTEQLTKAVIRSATSTIGRQIGNQIVRGILGSILKR